MPLIIPLMTITQMATRVRVMPLMTITQQQQQQQQQQHHNSSNGISPHQRQRITKTSHCYFRTKMSTANNNKNNNNNKVVVIDSHLHVWASPTQAVEKYPYFPGQQPTIPGHAEFLLQCMEEAGVDGALIVQPINHKFDHSYVTSVLKRYPGKFSGCCLANPAEDGSGIRHLEDLVTKDGYCAVRFNPYLWPSGQKMTNEIGKAMFSKAGELGIPVGFMCMKGLDQHFSEIEELCTEYPSTIVLLDHLGFCKPPITDEENSTFLNLLELSKFPQVYVKLSALFRVSREPFPYLDISSSLSQVIFAYGAHRIMWGSDFPFVVPECGYEAAKNAVSVIAKAANLSALELDWIFGGTVMKMFSGRWASS